MTARLRLDHAGIAEVLRSAEVTFAVTAKAAEVQDAVETHHSVARHRMPVERHSYETDRAADAVTIAHPGGLGVEAKYGVLSEAARTVGLDVNADQPRRHRRRRRERPREDDN
ncbi:hypothetical protein [Krasilnikovia sp. MM14-A1259]|uniref:hypothetical protein n=1 Tax=Krasilnikovia sp. MM14-A1259 TaxID=3373539 RepID=UPI0037FCE600